MEYPPSTVSDFYRELGDLFGVDIVPIKLESFLQQAAAGLNRAAGGEHVVEDCGQFREAEQTGRGDGGPEAKRRD